MAGRRVTTSGQTGIHLSSSLWAGVKRTARPYILLEVSSYHTSIYYLHLCMLCRFLRNTSSSLWNQATQATNNRYSPKSSHFFVLLQKEYRKNPKGLCGFGFLNTVEVHLENDSGVAVRSLVCLTWDSTTNACCLFATFSPFSILG